MLRYFQIVLFAVLCNITFLLIPTLSFTHSEAEHLSHHPELAAQATTTAGSPSQAIPGGGTSLSPEHRSAKPVASTEGGAKAESKIKEIWAGKLKVSKIVVEAPNVKTFRLVDPAGRRLPFTFVPGQFLTLFALIDKKTVARAYTIASSPTEVSFCDLTIKREDQGTFSRYLHDLIKEGDLIDVKGPSGLFVFTGVEANSIVLIGAGIGVTPMMSVLRFLTTRAWPGKITLLFTYRNSEDYLFRHELEELTSRFSNFKLIVTATGKVGSDWSGRRGRFTKEIIATVPDLVSSRVHLCGPVPFMEDIKRILSELAVPKESIKIEAFGSMRKDESVTPLGRDRNSSRELVGTNIIEIKEQFMTNPHSDTLVFFGATGDLVYKKIFPALYAMERRGHLQVPVIGVARVAATAQFGCYPTVKMELRCNEKRIH